MIHAKDAAILSENNFPYILEDIGQVIKDKALVGKRSVIINIDISVMPQVIKELREAGYKIQTHGFNTCLVSW